VELSAAEWRSLGEAIQHYGHSRQALGENTDRAARDALQAAVDRAWTAIVGLVVPWVDGHPHNHLRDRQATDEADASFIRYLTTHRIHPLELLAICVTQALDQKQRHLLRPRLEGFLRAYRLTSSGSGIDTVAPAGSPATSGP
jgi:1,2-phenylacetyl-CoA epoxidase catalytic subunit